MATAKQRGAPVQSSADQAEARRKQRAAQKEVERLARIEARQAKRKANRKKLDDARAPLKNLAKDILKETFDKRGSGKFGDRIPYQKMTEEMLEWFEAEVVKGASVALMPDRRPDFPCEYQLWCGIGDEESTLSKCYARGKQLAVARIEEQIVTTSTSQQFGITKIRRQALTRDGDVVDIEEEREADMLGHRALVVDTLKWQLAHIRPKKHGRNPELKGDEDNKQLKSLFDALMQGPAE